MKYLILLLLTCFSLGCSKACTGCSGQTGPTDLEALIFINEKMYVLDDEAGGVWIWDAGGDHTLAWEPPTAHKDIESITQDASGFVYIVSGHTQAEPAIFKLEVLDDGTLEEVDFHTLNDSFEAIYWTAGELRLIGSDNKVWAYNFDTDTLVYLYAETHSDKVRTDIPGPNMDYERISDPTLGLIRVTYYGEVYINGTRIIEQLPFQGRGVAVQGDTLYITDGLKIQIHEFSLQELLNR